MPSDPVADAEALTTLIRDAVRTLVPILPVNGGPKSGYTLAWDMALRGREDEIRAAAVAMCALYEAIR